VHFFVHLSLFMWLIVSWLWFYVASSQALSVIDFALFRG
jgi:hypothetical protein